MGVGIEAMLVAVKANPRILAEDLDSCQSLFINFMPAAGEFYAQVSQTQCWHPCKGFAYSDKQSCSALCA